MHNEKVGLNLDSKLRTVKWVVSLKKSLGIEIFRTEFLSSALVWVIQNLSMDSVHCTLYNVQCVMSRNHIDPNFRLKLVFFKE